MSDALSLLRVSSSFTSKFKTCFLFQYTVHGFRILVMAFVCSEIVAGTWESPNDESTHKQAMVSFTAEKKELSRCQAESHISKNVEKPRDMKHYSRYLVLQMMGYVCDIRKQ
jgi:hypothetical protein